MKHHFIISKADKQIAEDIANEMGLAHGISDEKKTKVNMWVFGTNEFIDSYKTEMSASGFPIKIHNSTKG